MNYAFGLCFPFIFGFIVAVALQKPVNLLTKKTPLKRGLARVLCVFILVFVVGTVAYLIGFKLVDELRGFFDYMMLKFENIPQLVDDIEKWINNCIASFPQQLQSLLSSATDKIFNTLDKLAATAGDTSAIPESTTSLGNSAFHGCERLADVYYPGTAAQWRALAWEDIFYPTPPRIHYNAE